jgi:hypothetical protein
MPTNSSIGLLPLSKPLLLAVVRSVGFNVKCKVFEAFDSDVPVNFDAHNHVTTDAIIPFCQMT